MITSFNRSRRLFSVLMISAAPAFSQADEGTVKWFNGKQGYGIIITQEGDELMVHEKDIVSEGIKVLTRGETVAFEAVHNSMGRYAANVVPK